MPRTVLVLSELPTQKNVTLHPQAPCSSCRGPSMCLVPCNPQNWAGVGRAFISSQRDGKREV